MAVVAVPTVSRLQSSAMDFGVGALGGLVFNIASGIFGSSLLGGLASAAASGAVLPGPRGQIVATMAGFQALAAGGLGGDGGGTTADTGPGEI